MRERDHMEDPGVDVSIIFVVLQEGGCRGIDSIDVTQDGDSWQALVNAATNIRIPYNAENFLIS